MAKAKTADTAADAMGAAAAEGTEKVKAMFEKATAGFEKLGAFQKGNYEAMVASAGVSTKAMEKMASELASYAKTASEGFSEATKTIFGSKSLQAAMEAQSAYMKSSYEGYVSEMTKLSEMFTGAAREAIEPLQVRAQAFKEIFQPAL